MSKRSRTAPGIRGKLLVLAIVITAGMGLNSIVAWNSLSKLSATVGRQSSASAILIGNTDIQRLCYVSWLALFRVRDAYQNAPATLPDAVDYFERSLADAQAALAQQGFLGTEDQIRAAVSELDGAFAAYKESAQMDAAAFKSLAPGALDSFSITALSFSSLAGALQKVTDAVRQEQALSAELARVSAADSAMVLAGVSFAVLAFALGFTALTMRSITKPLGALVAAVDAASSGDLTVAGVRAGGGELGRIAERVDNLVSDLRSLILTVKDRLRRLEDEGGNLASAMEQTGAAVVQINSNISSTRTQLGEQSAAVREVAAAIEELARNVDALANMIHGQSAVISESSSSIEEMIANLESMRNTVQAVGRASDLLLQEGAEGKRRMDEVVKTVASIVKYSENLGVATKLIKEISGRTNLLAMNAAIEAAHAGQSGRGFAVVADEIRKLAEQSASQAKEIAQDLGRVAASIQSVQGASGGAAASFGSILERSTALGDAVREISAAMMEQREGGVQVLDGLERLKDSTAALSQGSEGMAEAKSDILAQVDRLRTVNEMVVGNNEEITRGTEEINKAVSGTIELSARNTFLIAEVREAADKFRT